MVKLQFQLFIKQVMSFCF